MRIWYALLNVGFMWLGVKLRRATFLIFGALGVFIYLGHLAYEVFKDSFFFPFVLALLGLGLILLTVWMQRRVLARANA
jgi:sensor histidine kinase YesM